MNVDLPPMLGPASKQWNVENHQEDNTMYLLMIWNSLLSAKVLSKVAGIILNSRVYL
jgi:hypothetical protein